jgi:hypothetical protein
LSGDISLYQTNINPNGTTQVDLFYDRIEYRVEVNTDDENK